MAAIMSDPPKVDGKAQLKSGDMDDSHPVHAPSSLSNNSSTLPGTPSSDHSVFNDSFASTQAQPANSAAGHESESEDTSEAVDDCGDDFAGDDTTPDYPVAVAAKKFAERAYQQLPMTADNLAVSPAVLRYIDKGAVLDYLYHKGVDEHGAMVPDLEYPEKVNAFSECRKWLVKLNEHGFAYKDDKGNAFWAKEDKTRCHQIWVACRHHVLQDADVVATTFSNFTSPQVHEFLTSKNPEAPVYVTIDDTISEAQLHSTLDESEWGERAVSVGSLSLDDFKH